MANKITLYRQKSFERNNTLRHYENISGDFLLIIYTENNKITLNIITPNGGTNITTDHNPTTLETHLQEYLQKTTTQLNSMGYSIKIVEKQTINEKIVDWSIMILYDNGEEKELEVPNDLFEPIDTWIKSLEQ